MLSAKDAETLWRVVPVPYEVTETVDGVFEIYHRPFNSTLPGTYRTREELNVLLASILLGAIHPGDGNISFRGQPMQLCEPLDFQSFPARPEIHPGRVELSGFSFLRTITFEAGYMPVNEAQFIELQERESEWVCHQDQISRYAHEHATELWARVTAFKLDTLGNPAGDVMEFGQDELNELRKYYPELTMLNDASLYYWFTLFQMENSTLYYAQDFRRDDTFLFYLLGKVADHHFSYNIATLAGFWAAYSLIRGNELEAALNFGRRLAVYEGVISSLSARVEAAIRFLSEEKASPRLQRPAIITMNDLFSISRKYNGTHEEVRQSLSDVEE